VLVFLPGEGEIRRAAARWRPPAGGVEIRPLYGALPFAAQRAAIRPATAGRKVVLATAIAETSLTIEDIRVVVDAGRARRARFDPGSGMSRLVTERVTRAEAEQRGAARAGWRRASATGCGPRGEEGALPPSRRRRSRRRSGGLALDLALWGAAPAIWPSSPRPIPAAMPRRRRCCGSWARWMARGGSPRMARRWRRCRCIRGWRICWPLSRASRPRRWPRFWPSATRCAARPADLSLRLAALRDPKGFAERSSHAANRGAVERIRAEAKRLGKARAAPPNEALSPAEMAALAYPDRIGLRRPGDAPRYVLSGGKGAVWPEGDPLAGARLIVATDLDGDRREARIRRRSDLAGRAARAFWPTASGGVDVCLWSGATRKVLARRQERLGALVLDDRVWRDAPEAQARAMLEGVRDLGLPGGADAARRRRARRALAAGGRRSAGHVRSRA
jgi:ATP-dependent helicase HrpB